MSVGNIGSNKYNNYPTQGGPQKAGKATAGAAAQGAAQGAAKTTSKASTQENKDTVNISSIAGAAGAATAAVALGPAALPATMAIATLKGVSAVMNKAEREDQTLQQMARELVNKWYS